jgi:hypothetical protein
VHGHTSFRFSRAVQDMISEQPSTSSDGFGDTACLQDSAFQQSEVLEASASNHASSVYRPCDSAGTGPKVSSPGCMGCSASDKSGGSARVQHRGVVRLVVKGSGITEDGLRELFQDHSKCRHALEELDVSRCSRVSLKCLRHLPSCSALRDLTANGCTFIRELSVALPVDCPLQRLSLQACSHLTTLQLTAPHLRRLAVSSNKLLSVSVTAPCLQELNVTNCPELGTLKLHGPLAAAAAQLVHLNLTGCARLPSAALHTILSSAARLEGCNISSCRQFGAVVIPGPLSSSLSYAL